MRVLLDTYVLSELRRPDAHAGVLRAINARDCDDLFVSVISEGEIAKDIALLDASRNKRALQGLARRA